MGNHLAIATIAFPASAAPVIYLDTELAKYRDVLTSLTGLGQVFIGSILVAMVTSLPELSTNFAAVRLDPPNPDLAIGNVLGANMLNMFTCQACGWSAPDSTFSAIYLATSHQPDRIAKSHTAERNALLQQLKVD